MTEAPYPRFDGSQACSGADRELFFPTSTTAEAALERTKPLCLSCSFRRPCLAYALTHSVDGIWSATTEAMRAAIRQRHGITPEPITEDDPPPADVRPLWQRALELHQQGLSVRQVAAELGITVPDAATLITRHRPREVPS